MVVRIRGAALRFWLRSDIQFVVHSLLLLASLVVLRPLFSQGVAGDHYAKVSILRSLWSSDIETLVKGAQRGGPVTTQIVFVLVPTLLFLFAKRLPRWQDFDSGLALRTLIVGLLALLAWTGALGPYNVYLHRGHTEDRLLLIGLTVLAWRTPLAVPLATRWVTIMIREAYVPIAIDDFDYRSVHELLVVFSSFVWLSFIPTLRTKHFFFAAVGCWAAYYFAAGWSKIHYGPAWSWLRDNHLSNLAINSYVRGWLSFVPEHTYLGIHAVLRTLDQGLAAFTLIVELGALFCFFVHPRVARIWFLMCFLFNFGVYLLSGICFWKWMGASLLFFAFARGGGAEVMKAVCRHWLVVGFGILVVFTGKERLHFNPQVGVAWYDARLMENYEIIAIGRYTRQSYVVSPNDLNPGETHFVQGRLCYATNERSATGIYGSTGSYRLMMDLEQLDKPEDAMRFIQQGAPCNTPKLRPLRDRFDDYMVRFFTNLNRWGRPDAWYHWAGPPRHLWEFARGRRYERQEPVTRIELWREVVIRHGDRLHRLERKLVHSVAIDPVPGAK